MRRLLKLSIIERAAMALLLFMVVTCPSQILGRRTYARYQRGDQGPDTTDALGGVLPPGGPASNSGLPAPIGGPNVCRSRQTSFCCPGWTQRGTTGLCLVPLCDQGCGDTGHCLKPNICMCDGGRITPKCGAGAVQSGSAGAFNSEGVMIAPPPGCGSTCLNGGTCGPDNVCACRPGYAGEYCQEPVCKRECENGGRCIGPNRCACVYGYTGRYCEIDYRTGPCYRRVENGEQCTGALEGVVCTRQLCCATIGAAWGHPCEECPDDMACEPGFLKNVHTGKCMDINECEAIPGKIESFTFL